MPLVCRNCSRVNPADALYCYHDGVALGGSGGDGGPVAAGTRRFHTPFVFPSGRSCRSFDELVLACESHWSEAQDVLRQGYLEGFLGGQGRADLARAARQAALAADSDRALDEFLAKLPATTRQPPHLEVRPLEINLGQLSRDSDRRLALELTNLGMGLLTGSISTNCDWISLGEGTGSPRKLVQLRTEASIPIRIIGKCLRAGAKKLEGRLNIETNGGGATVVVRAEVPVRPFPSGVLGGARTPRELASKAKHHIKEAAPCFERGEVEAWYRDNGWIYPVQGPNFSGIHAIQQFFEALGLVTPPRVEISTRSLTLAGSIGNALTEEVTVRAEEKKPVFAYGVSSAPWLKVGKTILEGRIARIPLSVSAIPPLPGERLQARVEVTANGNQRFTVEVTLNVAGGRIGNPSNKAGEPVLEMAGVSSHPGYPATSFPNEPPGLSRREDRRDKPGGSSEERGERVRPVVEVNYADLAADQAPGPQRFSVPPPVPSLADLYAAGAPVATLVPLPSGPASEPVLEVLPVQPQTDTQVLPTGGTILDEPGDESGGRIRQPWWVHLLPLAFLALCLLATLCCDLLRVKPAPAASLTPEALDPQPRILLRFHDEELRIPIGAGGIKPVAGHEDPTIRHAYWEPSMRFGLLMLNQPEPARFGLPKRLTFEEAGTTNNTVVKIDRNEWIFGERPFRERDGRWIGDWPGRWLPSLRDVRLKQTPYSVEGRASTWYYDPVQVEVTQTVEIVRGVQSNLLDTCLVRYRLHNKDSRPHFVGIRFLLDTFIGSNDGVPFLIPGATALCSTSKEFQGEQVPHFIQALEREDLSRPGTIAQVGFRVGNGLEPPSRVTLGAWPNVELKDPLCQQEKTKWEVPVLKIHSLEPGDSAVTIYWDPRELAPGRTRDVGFTYGLGTVSSGEGAGKLALTVGGSFAPRGEFTVTAYVSNPARNQTVTLTLPAGFALIDSPAQQPVPPLPPDGSTSNSPVTWKVRGPSQEGKYTLKVDSSTGATQTQAVKIRTRGLFGE